MTYKSRFNIGLMLLLLLAQACSGTRNLSTAKKRTSPTTTTASNAIVKSASQYIGAAYKYGGNGPKAFDCSGLVHKVFAAHGKPLPRTSSQQSKAGKAISIQQARVGDLLFFTKNKSGGPINHVALVVKRADGKMWVIHSTTSKGVIREDILSSVYWTDRLHSARRIP